MATKITRSLANLKTLPKCIFNDLSSDQVLLDLLLNDQNDDVLLIADEVKWEKYETINQSFQEKLLGEGYFNFTPMLDINITNTKRNTFIAINLDNIDFFTNEDNIDLTGAIFIGTDQEHAVIRKDKLRLLEMIDRIYNLLDGKKYDATGKLKIDYATFVVYSEYVFGYKIAFSLKDLPTRKAEL